MRSTEKSARVLAKIYAALVMIGLSGCSKELESSVPETLDTYTSETDTAERDSAEVFTAHAETADSAETAAVLFSDSFDYDGDGYEEDIFFTLSDDIRRGTVPAWYYDDWTEYKSYISVWYSDESGEKRCAEIGADIYKSDIFSVFDSGGQHFVSVNTGIAMGLGAPTVCLTVADNIPVQVGNTAELNISDHGRTTIFTVLEGVPFVRDCGPTAGTNNLYPLYWDGTEFKIYETTPSDMDFVRMADINNIVPEIENVINVLVRSNGLLHINYYADHIDIPTESGIRSATYVLEDNIITEIYDMGEGFSAMPTGIYRECMPVRDSDLNIIE